MSILLLYDSGFWIYAPLDSLPGAQLRVYNLALFILIVQAVLYQIETINYLSILCKLFCTSCKFCVNIIGVHDRLYCNTLKVICNVV